MSADLGRFSYDFAFLFHGQRSQQSPQLTRLNLQLHLFLHPEAHYGCPIASIKNLG